MIYLFLGLMMLIAQYFMRDKQWEFTEQIRYMLIFAGFVFLAYDTYYELMLPAEITSFGNGGSGLAIGNQTFYTANDARLAYFAGHTSQEYVFINLLFTAVLWAFPVMLVLYAIDWAGKHNFLMGRMADNRRGWNEEVYRGDSQRDGNRGGGT